MQVKKQKILYNIKKSSEVRSGRGTRPPARTACGLDGLPWVQEKEIEALTRGSQRPRAALASLGSLPPGPDRLERPPRRAREWIWNEPLNEKEKPERKKHSDHCGLETEICVATFVSLLRPLLQVKMWRGA